MKSHLIFVIGLLGVAAGLWGCGAQMHNLPVGAGQTRLSASSGGPLVEAFDTVIPIPYSVVGITHGMSNHVDLHADLHLTALAYGFWGLTPGLTWFPRGGRGPLVPAVTGDLLVFSDSYSTRALPELTTTLTFPLNSRVAPFCGVRHTFQTTRGPVYLPSLFIGTSLRAGRVRFYAEGDWLAVNQDNRWSPVDYRSLGRGGAAGIQVGLSCDLRRSQP